MSRQPAEAQAGREPGDASARQRWEESRNTAPHRIEARIRRQVELVRGRGVDQRDPGSLLRKVHRVHEGVGATDGVTGKDVRAGNVRSREKPVEVGGKLVSILPLRRIAAPTLTRTVKGAEGRGAGRSLRGRLKRKAR